MSVTKGKSRFLRGTKLLAAGIRKVIGLKEAGPRQSQGQGHMTVGGVKSV